MKFWKDNLQAGNHLNLDSLVKQSSPYESQIMLEVSKKGPYTLRLNGHYLYSKYDPISDAKKFIESQIDEKVKDYYLFGLGLGYHALALIALEKDKPLFIIEPNMNMLRTALENIDLRELLSHPNINIVTLQSFKEVIDSLGEKDCKLIIPGSWLNALSEKHPLKEILYDIKMKEITYERFSQRMKKNFYQNIKKYDLVLEPLFNQFTGQKAALISAGPSLQENIDKLEQLKGRYFILCVGSALRVLMNSGVGPDAVIVTDPQDSVFYQLNGLDWQGPLLFLPTANSRAVESHKGLKIVGFQNGYLLSEEYAENKRISLVDTGGSVATTGLDVLIKMGFEEIVFFGQDLAMPSMKTHAEGSNSQSSIVTDKNLLDVYANDGSIVKTKKNLNIYRKWIEKKVAETPNVVFKNTAYQGAKIAGVQYITAEDIVQKASNMGNKISFGEIITSIRKRFL